MRQFSYIFTYVSIYLQVVHATPPELSPFSRPGRNAEWETRDRLTTLTSFAPTVYAPVPGLLEIYQMFAHYVELVGGQAATQLGFYYPYTPAYPPYMLRSVLKRSGPKGQELNTQFLRDLIGAIRDDLNLLLEKEIPDTIRYLSARPGLGHDLFLDSFLFKERFLKEYIQDFHDQLALITPISRPKLWSLLKRIRDTVFESSGRVYSKLSSSMTMQTQRLEKEKGHNRVAGWRYNYKGFKPRQSISRPDDEIEHMDTITNPLLELLFAHNITPPDVPDQPVEIDWYTLYATSPWFDKEPPKPNETHLDGGRLRDTLLHDLIIPLRNARNTWQKPRDKLVSLRSYIRYQVHDEKWWVTLLVGVTVIIEALFDRAVENIMKIIKTLFVPVLEIIEILLDFPVLRVIKLYSDLVMESIFHRGSRNSQVQFAFTGLFLDTKLTRTINRLDKMVMGLEIYEKYATRMLDQLSTSEKYRQKLGMQLRDLQHNWYRHWQVETLDYRPFNCSGNCGSWATWQNLHVRAVHYYYPSMDEVLQAVLKGHNAIEYGFFDAWRFYSDEERMVDYCNQVWQIQGDIDQSQKAQGKYSTNLIGLQDASGRDWKISGQRLEEEAKECDAFRQNILDANRETGYEYGHRRKSWNKLPLGSLKRDDNLAYAPWE